MKTKHTYKRNEKRVFVIIYTNTIWIGSKVLPNTCHFVIFFLFSLYYCVLFFMNRTIESHSNVVANSPNVENFAEWWANVKKNERAFYMPSTQAIVAQKKKEEKYPLISNNDYFCSVSSCEKKTKSSSYFDFSSSQWKQTEWESKAFFSLFQIRFYFFARCFCCENACEWKKAHTLWSQ